MGLKAHRHSSDQWIKTLLTNAKHFSDWDRSVVTRRKNKIGINQQFEISHDHLERIKSTTVGKTADCIHRWLDGAGESYTDMDINLTHKAMVSITI